MTYKGYKIKADIDHYVILDENNNVIATADTMAEAKAEIDRLK